MTPGYKMTRMLIFGKTYPELSDRYVETVCTGAIKENGEPIRLYPIPFRYLGNSQFSKYQWITAPIKKSDQDSRPESYKIDYTDITCHDTIPSNSQDGWQLRREVIFKNKKWLFNSVEELQQSQITCATSLGVVTPREIVKVFAESRSKEEMDEYLNKHKRLKEKSNASSSQGSLFDDEIPTEMKNLEYLGTRIKIEWLCSNPKCNGHKMTVLDWELGELLRRQGVPKAVDKMEEISNLKTYDLQFFLGNIKSHPRSFIIAGLWYPKKTNLISMDFNQEDNTHQISELSQFQG